jgi:hypothetical protein
VLMICSNTRIVVALLILPSLTRLFCKSEICHCRVCCCFVSHRSCGRPDQKETQPWLQKFMESNGASWQTSVPTELETQFGMMLVSVSVVDTKKTDGSRRRPTVTSARRHAKSMRWFDRQETVFKTVTTRFGRRPSRIFERNL